MFELKDLKKSEKLEKNFERNTVVKKLKALFPDCYEIPKSVRPSSKGTPDRQFVINGKFVAIEAKRQNKGVIAPIQIKRIEDIRKAGGYAFFADSWEDVVDNLKGVFECFN